MPNAKKVNDKTKTTIFVAQNDKAAKWYYTRDNPNGLPQLKRIKIKGKEAWDDTEVMEFLEKMIVEKILPQLSNENKITSMTAADGLAF